jgi:hypothetical protein
VGIWREEGHRLRGRDISGEPTTQSPSGHPSTDHLPAIIPWQELTVVQPATGLRLAPPRSRNQQVVGLSWLILPPGAQL